MSTKLNLFWIHGNKRDCDKKYNELLSRFKTWRHFRFNSENTAYDVQKAILEKDVFGDKGRLITLRYLIEDYSNLLDILKDISPNRAVIIVSPLNYKLFGKQVKADSSKVYQLFKSSGEVFQSPTQLNEFKSKQWLTSSIDEDFKIGLNSECADLILKKTNYNIDIAYNECKKIAEMIHPKRTITLDIVESCVVDVEENNLWRWLESVFLRKETVIQELEEMLNDKVEIEFILTLLISKVETILFIKDGCEHVSYNCVSSVLKQFNKFTKSGVLPRYSPQAISQMANSDVIKTQVKLGLPVLVTYLNILYKARNLIRENSSLSYKRSILFLAVLAIFDKSFTSSVHQLFSSLEDF